MEEQGRSRRLDEKTKVFYKDEKPAEAVVLEDMRRAMEVKKAIRKGLLID
ncbi:hypothetical protein [Thermococcus piezophilus]